eukprot:2098262-Lingulodinium_polyedra.AAC.1
MPGYNIAQVSGTLFTALQETVSDALRMTKPDLAGDARGLELWRLLVREHEAPEQPIVQREYRRKYQNPVRCKDANELKTRLPAWETLGQQLVTMTGPELDETTKILSLDELIPEDYHQALDDKPELVSYAERIQFVKRRLGLIKHRALAQAAMAEKATPMDLGALGDSSAEEAIPAEGVEAIIAALR